MVQLRSHASYPRIDLNENVTIMECLHARTNSDRRRWCGACGGSRPLNSPVCNVYLMDFAACA